MPAPKAVLLYECECRTKVQLADLPSLLCRYSRSSAIQLKHDTSTDMECISAGQVHSQAASRSGWSLHSITFSAADAKASEARQQLTLSQMTWSIDHTTAK